MLEIHRHSNWTAATRILCFSCPHIINSSYFTVIINMSGVGIIINISGVIIININISGNIIIIKITIIIIIIIGNITQHQQAHKQRRKRQKLPPAVYNLGNCGIWSC
ncbi:hypothetical protein ElyMa_001798400 [Elysia marginata]|uniref:Uncharacterized protein n=1 Tax=Elysia marginata TaxID=1093978 RepID=A0AAV4EF18_9GAST|nr:hypothetical protein ElyMa_001798400 [Elysia marginata]